MFQDNKYTKIYFCLIDKRRKSPLSRNDMYVETHHIVPKSLGGDDSSDNLINLLPREHFIAHLLLTKMVENKNDMIRMFWALHRMVFSNMHSRQYDYHRKTWSKFLRENHHSKRIVGWNEKMSNLVRESWEHDEDRRKRTSDRAKLRWQDPDYREKETARLREIAQEGGRKAKLAVGVKVEYNDRTYLTWNDLLKETGISKFLYNKFYKQGIDPVFRVGKDGPMKKDDITMLIEMYCKKQAISVPYDEQEIEKVLQRMSSVGLVSQNEIKNYMRKETL